MGHFRLLRVAIITLCVLVLFDASSPALAAQLAVSSYPFGHVREYDTTSNSQLMIYHNGSETFGAKGIAYRGDGTIYVTGDSDNISVFDATTGQYIRRLDTGSDSNFFRNPEDLVFGSNGYLYASVDSGLNQPGIWVFDPDSGAVIDTFASVSGVRGLALDNTGYLYTAGYYDGTINKLDPSTGTIISTFDPANISGLEHPSGLTIGPDGLLYAADLSGNILRYDLVSGDFVDIFISSTTGVIRHPYDLEFDNQGNLYVSDWQLEKVQTFNASTGAFLGTLTEIDSGSTTGLTYLAINNIPIPAAFWLFGSGLLALVGIAKRKLS